MQHGEVMFIVCTHRVSQVFPVDQVDSQIVSHGQTLHKRTTLAVLIKVRTEFLSKWELYWHHTVKKIVVEWSQP